MKLVGVQVPLLDILTILSLLSRGKMEEKAEVLFKLYNFTENGRMSELELIRFILKVSELFVKLKLVGSLEISLDDARYFVHLARLKGHEKCFNKEVEVTDGPEGMIPYFQLQDFQHFLQTNQVTLVIFKTIDTLTRCPSLPRSTNRSFSIHTTCRQ